MFDTNRLPFADRMQTLTTAWRNVATRLRTATLAACDNLIHQVMRQTLHTMLMGEWPTGSAADRAYIRQQIEQCLPLLYGSPTFLNRARYILEHLEEPWAHPVLQRLMGVGMKTAEDVSELTADIEYFTLERASMVALRLEILSEARLYPMVSALAGNFLRVIRACHPRHPLRRTTLPAQIDFVHDLHLAVLYRLRRFDAMLTALRAMDLPTAAAYSARHMPHRYPAHLYKHCDSVMDTALQVFLTRFLSTDAAASRPHDDDDAVDRMAYEPCVRQLCIVWVHRNAARPTFAADWRKLVALGPDHHRHFYLLLDVLTTMTTVIAADVNADAQLELLIRGITHELNEMEQLKTNVDCDARTLLAAEQRLAPRFDQLTVMFQDSCAQTLMIDNVPVLAHELLLTSFSLHPLQSKFNRIQRYAHEKRHDTQLFTSIADVLTECPRHDAVYSAPDGGAVSVQAFIVCPACGTRCVVRPKTAQHSFDSSDNRWRNGTLHSVSGYRIVQSDGYNVLAAPSHILDAMKLRAVPHARRLDLLTLISAPRIKSLSWLMEWRMMRPNLLELLSEPVKIRRAELSLATANERLEFVRPDYQRFWHLRANEYPGIEIGYEEFYQQEDNGFEFISCAPHESTASSSETEWAVGNIKKIQRRTEQAAARRRRFERRGAVASVEPSRRKIGGVKRRPPNSKEASQQKRFKAEPNCSSLEESVAAPLPLVYESPQPTPDVGDDSHHVMQFGLPVVECPNNDPNNETLPTPVTVDESSVNDAQAFFNNFESRLSNISASIPRLVIVADGANNFRRTYLVPAAAADITTSPSPLSTCCSPSAIFVDDADTPTATAESLKNTLAHLLSSLQTVSLSKASKVTLRFEPVVEAKHTVSEQLPLQLHTVQPLLNVSTACDEMAVAVPKIEEPVNLNSPATSSSCSIFSPATSFVVSSPSPCPLKYHRRRSLRLQAHLSPELYCRVQLNQLPHDVLNHLQRCGPLPSSHRLLQKPVVLDAELPRRRPIRSLSPSMIIELSSASDDDDDTGPAVRRRCDDDDELFTYHPDSVRALHVEPLVVRYDSVAETWRLAATPRPQWTSAVKRMEEVTTPTDDSGNGTFGEMNGEMSAFSFRHNFGDYSTTPSQSTIGEHSPSNASAFRKQRRVRALHKRRRNGHSNGNIEAPFTVATIGQQQVTASAAADAICPRRLMVCIDRLRLPSSSRNR